MASIPLPALDINSQHPQPDLIGQYGQLQALKQQAAMAPLQQQAAMQQVQSGQLDLEAKQRAAQNAKAMQATMQEWSQPKAAQQPAQGSGNTTAPLAPASPGAGVQDAAPIQGAAKGAPSYDDLVPLAIKNGASFEAVQALQQHILQMKLQAAEIAKNQAQGGEANMGTLQKKNEMIVDAINGLSGVPDEQLPQAIQQTSQELAQQGLFDPQHVQQAMQIAQLAQSNPQQARQQANLMASTLGAFSKQVDIQEKQLRLNAEKGKSDPNSPFYSPSAASVALGTAPQAAQIQAGEAAQAAQTAAAEANATEASKIRVAAHSPMAMVMGNQLAGEQNSAGLDLAAQNYRQTGQMPAGMTRSPQTTAAIINRAAQLDRQAGGQGIAANKTILNANKTSLANLQRFSDTVQAFEQTAEKNMNLLQSTAKDIPDLGVRFANIPVRSLTSGMIGTANMAKFHTALNVAQTEVAKVLNNPSSGAVLSDSARGDLQKLIDGNMTYPAMVASLNTLGQDMKNRTESNQMQIRDIQQRITGAGSSQPQPAQGSTGNDPFAQFGGRVH